MLSSRCFLYCFLESAIDVCERVVIGMVKVKLLGIFGSAYGSREVELKIEGDVRLKEIIQKLTCTSKALKHVLIDSDLKSPLPNAVIIVNGKDISVLNGLDTPIKNGDEILIIPAIHGG